MGTKTTYYAILLWIAVLTYQIVAFLTQEYDFFKAMLLVSFAAGFSLISAALEEHKP